MSVKSDEDGRQAGEFTEEEGRIHQAGFKIIHRGLKGGLGFDEACAGLQVANPEMRRVIIADYLKITIAERHFQGGESLEGLAGDLKIPVERVASTKAEMLSEVQQAALEFYRRQGGGAGFGTEGADQGAPDKPGAPGKKKGS